MAGLLAHGFRKVLTVGYAHHHTLAGLSKFKSYGLVNTWTPNTVELRIFIFQKISKNLKSFEK
jgi:hypothetical protein